MRLFVGRLPFELTEEELLELFVKFGKVEKAKIIIDRDSGRSKGFGFVEMQDSNEAQEAIRKLNQSEVKGRTIVVSEAREREERAGGPPRGGERAGGFSRGRGNREDRGRRRF